MQSSNHWSLGHKRRRIHLPSSRLIVGISFGFRRMDEEAVRPELYIKTAIVLLAASSASWRPRSRSSRSRSRPGLAAIIEAYLIYWAVGVLRRAQMVRLQRRVGGAARLRNLDLRRVAAIATAARSAPGPSFRSWWLRCVVFAVVELLILRCRERLPRARADGGGRLDGAAVKTDGAGSGERRDRRIADLASAAARASTTRKAGYSDRRTVKIFIDISSASGLHPRLHLDNHIEVRRPGTRRRSARSGSAPEIHRRLRADLPRGPAPRYGAAPQTSGKIRAAMGEANTSA